jgi:uncharacterized protein with GYD domain
MAVYLHLSKLTREGAAKIRELGNSYSTWKSFAESQGAKIVCAAACFGEYDFAVVADYPNEVAALKSAGCATALGAVTVQTLPCCAIEDFVKVMSELPK